MASNHVWIEYTTMKTTVPARAGFLSVVTRSQKLETWKQFPHYKVALVFHIHEKD